MHLAMIWGIESQTRNKIVLWYENPIVFLLDFFLIRKSK